MKFLAVFFHKICYIYNHTSFNNVVK